MRVREHVCVWMFACKPALMCAHWVMCVCGVGGGVGISLGSKKAMRA